MRRDILTPDLNTPALLSSPRITTLIAATVVGLGSGPWHELSYGPQLAHRLNINHTHLSIIGLAGNVGVYSSGPVWGRIVDAKGPRRLFFIAFILLLCGYLGIKAIFDAGDPSRASFTNTTLFALVGCGYLTGAGGNSGFTGAVNATAKAFPDAARATATGIVLSGFGLSAFVFSTIAHAAYAGDTSGLLLLLAFGTSLPMILGFLFVRIIPLGVLEYNTILGPEIVVTSPTSSRIVDDTTQLLPAHEDDQREDAIIDIAGKRLWTSLDFWLLFTMLSLLSGTGLMYINNVGSISQALSLADRIDDPVIVARWQSTQVSVISLMNFSGRILIGLASDITKTRFHRPRSFCLSIVAMFFLSSQVAAACITDVYYLWISSALVGLSHGATFSLFPLMTIEWFGLPHFSENWGYVSLAPLIGGNVFSLAFGKNFDSHEKESQCAEGRACYVNSLYTTIGACAAAVLLGLFAARRDARRGM